MSTELEASAELAVPVESPVATPGTTPLAPLRRERKPRARVRPQALAAARGGALEGLD